MLIDDIIERLSAESAPLSEPLLKTKVLLHRIGKKDLAEWINNELNGYPETAELPDYRKLPSHIVGNVANMHYMRKNVSIPILHLPQNIQDDLMETRMVQSLAVLETMCSSDNDAFMRPVPMEFHAVFNQPLDNGFRVINVWSQTQMPYVRGILVQVRSRLLDFLLELKDGMGDATEDEKMKEKAENMDTAGMFRHAMFGDNTTVILGPHNTVSIQNEVRRGDFASLANVLAKAGIPDDELATLRQAVNEDSQAGEAPELSKGKTGAWFLNLMGKAAKGGLKIGTDAAAAVVTKALTAYFGGS